MTSRFQHAKLALTGEKGGRKKDSQSDKNGKNGQDRAPTVQPAPLYSPGVEFIKILLRVDAPSAKEAMLIGVYPSADDLSTPSILFYAGPGGRLSIWSSLTGEAAPVPLYSTPALLVGAAPTDFVLGHLSLGRSAWQQNFGHGDHSFAYDWGNEWFFRHPALHASFLALAQQHNI